MTQALNVWMNGELVGTWTVVRSTHTFRYDASWLQSPRRRSLSLSLPISSSLEIKGEVVRNYFDNLLPDNEKIRARIGRKFKAKTDPFDLLKALGRDCVGAVQLLPESDTPLDWNRIDCNPLSEEQIDEILRGAHSDATVGHDDGLFRISIAGAQEKTALTRHKDRWCRPNGSTPTTHILKLPLGTIGGSRIDLANSVHNEWLCAQIVTALGLPVATTSIATFGTQTVLVAERFDRAWMDDQTWIARLPQEDFCQALGIPPSKKYEQDGGPGMLKCLQLLQASQDKNDRLFFLLTQLTFFLLAAPDGHAKNYSIFLQRGDAYEMTPLYDILSVWPYLGNGPAQLNPYKAGLAMAMRSKNTHYPFKEIRTRHWYALAMKNGGPEMWAAMLALVERVDAALSAVEGQLPNDFPEQIWTAISEGMRSATKQFLSEPTT